MDDTAARTETAKDGRFVLSATEIGVYLKVYPPSNGGKQVTEEAVLHKLKQRQVSVFLLPEIKKALEEASGRPVLIGDPPPEAAADIRIQVRRDRLSVQLNVTLKENSPPISKALLLKRLSSAGIVYGIDHNALALLETAGQGSDVIVAHGMPPQKGADAVLTYHFDTEAQGRPEEIDEYKVDFKNINKFLNVCAEQLLVEKTVARPGVDGTDVFGNTIPSKYGRDLPLPAGKNTMKSEDGLKLLAASDGQLHFAHGRVNILPLLEIKDDVDFSSGNIDFIGSVLVHGSLQCGFSIKAAGNVEIRGNVSGGMIEAENIVVRKGIQGMNRSQINARSSISALFVENASLRAGKTVIISDVVMNSTIVSGVSVKVSGKRGRILGGHISAGEEICSKTVGNQVYLQTKLEVAGNPFLKAELDRAQKDLHNLCELQQESKRLFAYLDAQGTENLDAEKKERHARLSAQCIELEENIFELKERCTELKTMLKSLRPGIIRISDTLYPGVHVAIGRLSRKISDAWQHLSLYVRDGEICFSSDY